MTTEYIAYPWPEYQEYMGEEWFRKECYYCTDKDIYFIPINRVNERENKEIRKDIISNLKRYINCIKDGYDASSAKDFVVKEIDKQIAWLEKQGEQKPNYCHHEVDLSKCSEEYRKAYYDGWNNCNMQHSQCKSELDDVVKCLINGMKFYYEDNEKATWGTDKWSMPVKHIIEVLEKQGENKYADKVVIKKGEKPINWSEDDERIRTRLINLVNEVYDNTNYITFLEHKELLAWLEKLDDNVEL